MVAHPKFDQPVPFPDTSGGLIAQKAALLL
jgi:hypothetical protein